MQNLKQILFEEFCNLPRFMVNQLYLDCLPHEDVRPWFQDEGIIASDVVTIVDITIQRRF